MENDTNLDQATYRMLVGQRIKQIRDGHEMNQRDFAKKAGLSQSAIAQFESGERLPSTTALQKICESYGIPMEKLLVRAETANAQEVGKELLLHQLHESAKWLSPESIVSLQRLAKQLPKENSEK